MNPLDKRVLLKFNDEMLDFDSNFRIFLTTKKSNPNFLPDVFIRSSVINFTVTKKGLEDQLLGLVVRLEREEIETKMSDNIEKLSSYKKIIVGLEKKILKLLSESTISPVEDENLVVTLEESKITAAEIKIKFEESEILNKEINEIREGYRPIARRGSLIYFVIADVGLINSMYQFSLVYIKRLFTIAMERTPAENDLELRIKALMASIVKEIYTNVSRSLFEEHKGIFS